MIIDDKTPGTLEWFKAILEISTLSIGYDITDSPAMFLLTYGDDRVLYSFFVCKKPGPDEDISGCRLADNGYIYPYPLKEDGKKGLFDIPLTEECKKEVSDFIDKAGDIFINWLENYALDCEK